MTGNIKPPIHDGMRARGRTGIVATHGSALSALESGTSNPLLKPPAGKNINRHPANANKGRSLVPNPQAVGRKILAQAIALASDPHHPRHFDCGDD